MLVCSSVHSKGKKAVTTPIHNTCTLVRGWILQGEVGFPPSLTGTLGPINDLFYSGTKGPFCWVFGFPVLVCDFGVAREDTDMTQIVPEFQFIGLRQLEPACSTLVLDAEHKRGIKVPKGICTRLCFIGLVYVDSPLFSMTDYSTQRPFPLLWQELLTPSSVSEG